MEAQPNDVTRFQSRTYAAPSFPAPSAGRHGGTAATGLRTRARIWIPALAAAIIAGVAAAAIGERMFEHLRPPPAAKDLVAAHPAEPRPSESLQAKAHSRNAAVVYGVLGGLLGLALGLAGGITRQSVTHSVIAGFLGLVLGTLAGALPPLFVLPWHWPARLENLGRSQLVDRILIHAAFWCGLGAIAGLVYTIGRFGADPLRIVQGIFGGLLGAALAVFIHDAIAFGLFPVARADEAFASSTIARALAHLCVAVLVAVGIVFALPFAARASQAAE
jgi:hypothetical protein